MSFPSLDHPTVVLESGLAGPPQAWFAVAKLLDPDFRVVIHRRASGTAHLRVLAEQLRAVLRNPPYLFAAHSFGGLVVRQFATLYPAETSGIVFVDALPPTIQIHIGRAVATARLAQILAAFHLMPHAVSWAAKHIRHAEWVLQEVQKLPNQKQVLAEWSRPEFYASIASLLASLPRNLRIARALNLPAQIPTVSLHSDYPDPQGRRIEQSGHWIQVDQPHAVAGAIRELAGVP